MPEENNNFPLEWDYYLDWHVISKAQSLLEKAKTTIKFSKVKDEKTQQDLNVCMQNVYQTLGLLYSPETEQFKKIN